MEENTVRELQSGKTMHADTIVSFIKKTDKEIQKFFWDLDLEKVDFLGCSAMYTSEKIDSIIHYLKFIQKNLKNK